MAEDDAEFDKVLGQYRLRVGALLHPLRLYGQAEYVNQLVKEFESLGVQLHLKLSGVDMPYYVRDLHW